MPIFTNIINPLILAIILCSFYFLGLWLTVRALVHSPRPLRLAMTSFFLRLAVLITGFHFIMDHDPVKLVPCMAAFFITRTAASRMVQQGI